MSLYHWQFQFQYVLLNNLCLKNYKTLHYCNLLNLYTVGLLLEYIISWGPIAIIIIFQPEIRNVLESIGRSQLLGRHKVLSVDERERIVYEIVNTMDSLRKTRTGALIVLERKQIQNH